MIDVWLIPFRMLVGRHAETGKAGIPEISHIGGRHRVAAKSEEIERTALEAIRRLGAAAAEPHEVVAIARAPKQLCFFLHRPAGQRIARRVIEREQLIPARRRDRKPGDHLAGQATAIAGSTPDQVTGHQHVTPERLARKERCARKPQRAVEFAIEGGVEFGDIHPELAQHPLRDSAVERLG